MPPITSTTSKRRPRRLQARLKWRTRNVSDVDVSLALRAHDGPRDECVFDREVKFDVTTLRRLRDQLLSAGRHSAPGKFFSTLVEESRADA